MSNYRNTAPDRRQLVKDDLTRMNLPEEFWRAKVQGCPEANRELVIGYMQRLDELVHRPAGLLLWGKPGVGKTGIAAVISKEARSRTYTVYFAPVWELREDVRNRTMFDDSTNTLDRCRQVDLLVLDGLREEDAKVPFFGAREIEDLLVARASRRRPTILTTRMAPTSFEEKNFGGVFESLRGNALPVEVKGENRRAAQHTDLVQAVLGDKTRR